MLRKQTANRWPGSASLEGLQGFSFSIKLMMARIQNMGLLCQLCDDMKVEPSVHPYEYGEFWGDSIWVP